MRKWDEKYIWVRGNEMRSVEVKHTNIALDSVI